MSDTGGDPACWLERVCERCGGVIDETGHACESLEQGRLIVITGLPGSGKTQLATYDPEV